MTSENIKNSFTNIDNALGLYYTRLGHEYPKNHGMGLFMQHIEYEELPDPDVPIEYELGDEANGQINCVAAAAEEVDHYIRLDITKMYDNILHFESDESSEIAYVEVESDIDQHDDVIKIYEVKGNMYISREMTEKIIPFAVNIKMRGKQLYEYMNESTKLQLFDQFNTGQLRILNYDFHDKITNEILYCIVDRKNNKNKNKGYYEWRMRDKLFTLNEIQNIFAISNNKLPQSSRQKQSFINQLIHEDKIKNLIKNKKKQIIHHTKWNKLPIFNKKKNKKRMILSMTTRAFKNDLNQFISNNDENNNNDNNIIQIVIFDDDGGHHIEYVQIVQIDNNSVGISYKYDQQKNNIKPTGIHLNKEFIEQQHQLISPEHDYQCLNDFTSNIDDLQIGDPNTQKNQLIHYKNQCEKLANFIKDSVKYITKTASNVANMTINNLQKWLEKANKVIKNAKNVDITLDLASLYSADKRPNNAALRKSPLYVTRLEEINNFYFQQILNRNKHSIIPHPSHIISITT